MDAKQIKNLNTFRIIIVYRLNLLIATYFVEILNIQNNFIFINSIDK